MNRWRWSIVVLVVAIGFLGYCFYLNLERILQKTEASFNDTSLPVLDLALNDITWDEFKSGDKETKYEGNELSLYDGNDVKHFYDVTIKGRGNLTWVLDKRPLQLDLSHSEELLGLAKTKKWALLASYLDASYVRNDLALYLAEMLEIDYINRGKFVDLRVNSEEEGLYYLLPKIEIRKNVVDLRNNGGILVEVDNIHREDCYLSHDGNCLQVKDVVNEKDEGAEEAAMKDLLTDFDALEIAAAKHDYEKVASLADLESFAKYYLVNEFAVNPDAYSSSFYFYKDGPEDKIHAGPVWDFDLAFGNKEWTWHDIDDFYSPTQTMVRRPYVFGEKGYDADPNTSRLAYHLMEMPEFRAEVRRIFNEKMMGRAQEVIMMLSSDLDMIRESAVKDSEKWRNGQFEEEAQYLLDWVKARYSYFEEVYGDGLETAPIL